MAPARANPRSNRQRQQLFSLVKICISVGLVAFLLWRSGIAAIGSTLAGADLRWIAAGLVLGIGAAMLQANQWRGLLGAYGTKRGYWNCLRLDSAARLFDAALPTSIGGT